MGKFQGEGGKSRDKESIRSEIAGVNAQMGELDIKVQKLTDRLPLADVLGIVIAEEIKELAAQHELLKNRKEILTKALTSQLE